MKILTLLLLTSCGYDSMMFDWMESVADKKGKEMMQICLENPDTEEIECSVIENEDEDI